MKASRLAEWSPPPFPGGEGAAQVCVALISLTFTQNQAPLVWTSAAIRAALISYFKDTGKKRGALPGKGKACREP